MLPKSLSSAMGLMQNEPLFAREFGEVFLNYYVKLKTTEIGRYESYVRDHGIESAKDEVTVWEQNEYFDFF